MRVGGCGEAGLACVPASQGDQIKFGTGVIKTRSAVADKRGCALELELSSVFRRIGFGQLMFQPAKLDQNLTKNTPFFNSSAV